MMMPPSAPLILDSVTLGPGRISVIAVLSDACLDWGQAEWATLREAGASAAWLASGAIPRVPTAVPLLRTEQLAIGTNPDQAGALFFDTDCQFANYPRWSRDQQRPWGPLFRQADENSLRLALAAITAGASVVGYSVEEAEDLQVLVAELKSFAGLLGRELTRVPKRAEGSARPTPAGRDEIPVRYSAQAGSFRVGFQGEHGAFSEMAVFNLFPKSRSQAVPFKTFRDVFSAVLGGEVDFGMLPIENALAGPIDENFDLLLEFPDLHIIGETQVRIEHNLIGLPGTSLASVRKVYSHPQGLAQSRQFLDAHPEWEAIPFYDTAGSVAHVARTGDSSLAAIASAEAAEVYGMQILVPGVETNHRNFTRFFLVAPRQKSGIGCPNKASLVFATADEPGALSRCLAVFAAHGVNMKKLESRPIHGRPWDYTFYVDVSLPAQPLQFEQALAELAQVSPDCRLLGIYEA